jgi:hypothetical protein
VRVLDAEFPCAESILCLSVCQNWLSIAIFKSHVWELVTVFGFRNPNFLQKFFAQELLLPRCLPMSLLKALQEGGGCPRIEGYCGNTEFGQLSSTGFYSRTASLQKYQSNFANPHFSPV